MKRITLILLLLLFALGALPAMAQIDRDGDGLPNTKDSCPFRAGPKENNGCPADDFAPNPPEPDSPAPTDSDGDGLPDSDDQCPTVSGSRENRGCPASPDTSGGSTPNDVPTNPDISGSVSANPMPDTDGDGIPDDKDQCPTQSGPYENSGCPVGNPPDDVTASEPPEFTPPALPTDGCYVTPVSSSNVNVRKAPGTGAEVIGYLKSGVVYSADGYVIGTDMWFVVKAYEGGSGETGYSSRSVLLSSACAEIVAAPAAEAPRQVNLTTDIVNGNENPTIEYCIYQEVEEVGVFKEVCYEIEVPEGCVVTSSEAGVFTVDCGGGVVSVNPLFDDLPTEGLQVPTRNSEIGLMLQFTRVPSDGGASDGGRSSTAKYCIYQEVEEVGVFKEVCYEVEVPEGCWLETAEAGVFTTKCRPEIGGEGIWLAGRALDNPDANASLNLPAGIVVMEEPVNPLDLTIVPTTPDPLATAGVSFNFTKVEFEYDAGGLELDLRGTELGGTQGHDDGSTTVEYCIYVELYEVGVFNQVCYEVEVPANCVLTTSEAGVYTVVCEDDVVISLNPDLEGLPALDVATQPNTQGYILIELLPIKVAEVPDSKAILIGLLLPAIQK